MRFVNKRTEQNFEKLGRIKSRGKEKHIRQSFCSSRQKERQSNQNRIKWINHDWGRERRIRGERNDIEEDVEGGEWMKNTSLHSWGNAFEFRFPDFLSVSNSVPSLTPHVTVAFVIIVMTVKDINTRDAGGCSTLLWMYLYVLSHRPSSRI